MLRKLVFFIFFVVISNNANAQESTCDYFNLPKPKKVPLDFNPEILHLNGSFKFNVEIKDCNAIYFTTIDSKENIYFATKKNDIWSTPQIASFSDPNYSDADPFLNKEKNKIYFISERPTTATDNKLDWNIWYADLENDKWSNPKPLPEPINMAASDEYFFSISDNGNAFFSSNRAGGQGSFDVYTTKVLGNNTFTTPKNMELPISSEKYEFDPYIAPDERFMLFSILENGNSSLHISYKNGNIWTTPKNLGKEINLTNQDFAPSLSADGKFIFYSNNGTLKWVSSEILQIPIPE